MRVTPAQYAKTLYELTNGKSQKEIDGVVSDFTRLLKKNGQLRLGQDIANRFRHIYNQENNIAEAEVITREKLNSSLADKLREFIGKKYQVKEVVLNNRIDESIKGGIIIKVGDEVIDGSVNKQLQDLKSVLIK